MMDELDKAFHLVVSGVGGVRWRSFKVAGVENPRYEYYYAESRLYIIRDRISRDLWFCYAGSPKEAWLKYAYRSEQPATECRANEMNDDLISKADALKLMRKHHQTAGHLWGATDEYAAGACAQLNEDMELIKSLSPLRPDFGRRKTQNE